MTASPSVCPACGSAASGNFCSACGASLVAAHLRRLPGRRCRPRPGSAIAAAGLRPAPVAAAPRRGPRADRLDRGRRRPLRDPAGGHHLQGGARGPRAGRPPTWPTPAPAAQGCRRTVSAGAAGAAPDISQMTPRERFDRLFNRVMQAAEQGDTAQVERFTPMALGAYAQLDSINTDARYHAAVLQLQVGDAAGALALADTILARSPGHLFGYIVRGTPAGSRATAPRPGAGRPRFPGALRRRDQGEPDRVSRARAGDRGLQATEADEGAKAAMTRTIRVAHSPDSDDAFMFYALAEGKIDTGDLRYVHELSDIESLNQRARRAELEVTAVSIHAYAYLWRDYALLGSGSSMGDGYGPRLVATAPAARRSARGAPGPAGRRARACSPPPISRSSSISPTWSAVVMPFDRIEDAVHAGRRGRRAAHPRGPAHLCRHRPPPLGRPGRLVAGGHRAPAAAGRQRGPPGSRAGGDRPDRPRPPGQHRVRARASGPALAHAKQYNRGIGDERTDTFVGMYVNQWTVDYGPRGREAVQTLLDRGHAAGVIPERVRSNSSGD